MLEAKDVFPTCVGMNRMPALVSAFMPCIPHLCGDEPLAFVIRDEVNEYSPLVWG